MSIISEKYSKALVDAALSGNELGGVRQDFAGFVDALAKSVELRYVFYNKGYSSEKENRILSTAFSGKISGTFKKFISLVVVKRRETDIHDIYRDFLAAADKAEGNEKIDIISPVPMDDGQKEFVRDKLARKLSKHVVINNLVDESLIGGIIIRMKDKVLDNSVKAGLTALRKELVK